MWRPRSGCSIRATSSAPYLPASAAVATSGSAPGECQRLVLEVLRDAVEPLSGRVLAREAAARKGLEDSREVLVVVQKTALAVLRRLVAKGVVRRQALADGSHVWERG